MFLYIFYFRSLLDSGEVGSVGQEGMESFWKVSSGVVASCWSLVPKERYFGMKWDWGMVVEKFSGWTYVC